MIYDNIQLSYLLFPLFLFKKTDIHTNMIFYYTRKKLFETYLGTFLSSYVCLPISCKNVKNYKFGTNTFQAHWD